MAGPDLSVFQNQRSLLDQQRLQAAFEQQKALQSLAVQAQLAQASNNGLTAKDLISFQMQNQNHQDEVANRQAQLSQQMMIAQMGSQDRQAATAVTAQNANATLQQRQDEIERKNDERKAGAENGLVGALTGIDQQIADLDNLVGVKDNKGNYIKQPMAGVSGNFGLNSYLPNKNGSDASNANALIEKARSGTLLGGLASLKSSSSTGASGLGSLTEREGTAVSNSQAALQNSQSYDSFVTNASNYRDVLKNSRKNLVNGFNNIYNRQSVINSAPPAMPPALGNSSEGTVLTIGRPNGLIPVVNPKTGEAFNIQPEDLEDAMKEGFTRR